MKKIIKIALIVVAVSCLVFLPIMACGIGDVTAHSYTATQQITAVDIDVEHANITLVATTGETKVDYEEAERVEFRVTENGGLLRITEKDVSFIKEMAQGSDKVDIVVYAPANLTYISAETEYGFVKCEGFTVNEIELSSDRGKVTATDITARNAEFSSDRGNVVATRINVSASLELSSDRGDITASIFGTQAEFKTEVEKGRRSSSNISSTNVGSKRLEIEVESGDINVTFYGE